MTYSIWAYLIPTLGLYLLMLLLIAAFTVYLWIRKPKSIGRIWCTLGLLTAGMAAVLILLWPSMEHYVPLLTMKEWQQVVGTVEEITPAEQFPVFYDPLQHWLTPASFLRVSGEEYYILSDAGISAGDCLAITYCPEGNGVLQWEKVPPGTTAVNKPIESRNPDVDRSILPVPQFFALAVCAWVLVGGSFSVFQWQIVKYLMRHDTAKPGRVEPRKWNPVTGWLEAMVTGTAIMSIFTGSIPIVVMLTSIAGVLWFMRWDVLRTRISYENNAFTYTQKGASHVCCAADVRGVSMVPTKIPGCMCLEIHLSSGQTIRLEEINFMGLAGFQRWLFSLIRR